MSMGLIRERAQFDFMPLSACPDAIPQVARWWCDEWGLPQRHESMESYLGELASLKPGKLLKGKDDLSDGFFFIQVFGRLSNLRHEKCLVD